MTVVFKIRNSTGTFRMFEMLGQCEPAMRLEMRCSCVFLKNIIITPYLTSLCPFYKPNVVCGQFLRFARNLLHIYFGRTHTLMLVHCRNLCESKFYGAKNAFCYPFSFVNISSTFSSFVNSENRVVTL